MSSVSIPENQVAAEEFHLRLRRARDRRRQLWAGLIFLGYLGVLLTLAMLERSGGIELPAVWELRSPRDLLNLVLDTGAGVFVELLRFLPLAVLAVWVLPRRRGRLQRTLLTGVPAFVLALAAAGLVHVVWIGRPWHWPGASRLVLPALGCLLGAWIGSAWLRDRRTRMRLLPKIGFVFLAAGVCLIALGALAVESTPLSFEPTRVTTEDRRRLYRLFKGGHPEAIPEGQVRTLSLTDRDVEQLVTWGLSLGSEHRKALVRLDKEEARLLASAGFTTQTSGVYVNLAAASEIGVEDGRLRFDLHRLRVGRLETPRWVLRLASPVITDAIQNDRRVRALLAPVRSLEIDRSGARITYGHARLPSGFVADLFRGEGTLPELVPAVEAHVRHLVGSAETLPAGEARFGGAMEAAFAFARERSATGSAVSENRAAILALGMLLGHYKVESLVGPVTTVDLRQQARKAFRGTKLRGRGDWTQHFFVSAALTVISAANVSRDVGVLKEELDADGGSGFSFGDLLADRSGTSLAIAATQNETAARALQERLSRGFSTDDFFPPAEDLPEGITDAELKARYGGVDGEGYRRLAQEVDRRVAGCVAYRPQTQAP
jgi:hypothetical protein